jgi:hypothetical protein
MQNNPRWQSFTWMKDHQSCIRRKEAGLAGQLDPLVGGAADDALWCTVKDDALTINNKMVITNAPDRR